MIHVGVLAGPPNQSDRHVGRRTPIARSNDFEAMVASGIREVRESPFHAGSVPVAICPHRTPPEFLAGEALGVRQGILSRGWKSRLRDHPAQSEIRHMELRRAS